MTRDAYRGRRAAAIENDHLRVTVLEEGGHIAEIVDRRTGINALWTPPWPSIEPSTFDRRNGEYGPGVDAILLAGIMGHNLCLDIFGGPSAEEEAAGLTPHGEASIAAYEIDTRNTHLTMRARLPLAQAVVQRQIDLDGPIVRIRESVGNLTAVDRPIGWTQHVTLGPPFLQKGATDFRASATRSLVFESAFGVSDYLRAGAPFEWPHAPRADGGVFDLQRVGDVPASSGYTAHLMDPAREDAFFVAFSPAARLAFGYVWKRTDFPWMGIWEENHSRQQPPWNGRTLARGMEFGGSPFPETRRQMVDRGTLFGTRTYRWLPAKARLEVEYLAVAVAADRVPETLAWQ